MNQKSTAKGATPTGRKTPTTTRPASPKVDLTNNKKLVDSSRPSPSPKQNLSRSLNRKSPSNTFESSFLSHGVRKPYASLSHTESFHNSRHEDGDFNEQASTRSVLNDSQLAKLKVMVDHQKSEYENEKGNAKHFHSVSNGNTNTRTRSEMEDERHGYTERTLSGEQLVADMYVDGGHYSSRMAHHSSAHQHVEDHNRDDAISDITQDAGYMSVTEHRSPHHRNNNLVMSVPAATATLEPVSLSEMSDELFQAWVERFAEEGARRVAQQNAAAAAESAAAANEVLEALNARKHVKRSKSGGSEAMLSTKKSAALATNKTLTAIPSFTTYKERMARGGADGQSLANGHDNLDMIQMQQHHDALDKEVASAFGLQPPSLVPTHSSSPVLPSSGSIGIPHATSNSYVSPTGVNSVYPLSRGHTLSRGSGAHVPADKMWSDASPSHFSSPLVLVSESPSTGGMMSSLIHQQSGSINAAPISRDSRERERERETASSRTSTSRVNSTSDVDEYPPFARPSSGKGMLKTLETLREAKQHSQQLQQQQQQQQQQYAPESVKHQVVYVEKARFTPVESTSLSGHSRTDSGSNKAATSSSSHHGKDSNANLHAAIDHAIKIIRPSMKRTVSVGSDASSVDGLNMFAQHTVFTPAQQKPQQQQQQPEPAVSVREQEMKSSYDELLKRDLVLSPLTAWDDASVGSGWSHGSSRRGSTASVKKASHSTREHNYARSTASQASASEHSRIAKGHVVSPIKRSQY